VGAEREGRMEREREWERFWGEDDRGMWATKVSKLVSIERRGLIKVRFSCSGLWTAPYHKASNEASSGASSE
jgi:hypothetical protein